HAFPASIRTKEVEVHGKRGLIGSGHKDVASIASRGFTSIGYPPLKRQEPLIMCLRLQYNDTIEVIGLAFARNKTPSEDQAFHKRPVLPQASAQSVGTD